MGMTYDEALTQKIAARNAMNGEIVGTKAWRMAEEDLNFWQGKVAALAAAEARGPFALDRFYYGPTITEKATR